VLTYPGIIQAEYERRAARNPAYSYRGFARDLDLSQSFLSQVLSRKRKLGEETALLVSQRLRLKGARKKLFLQLVRLEQVRRPESKAILNEEVEELLARNPEFKALPEDVFNAVAHWQCFALLELTALPGFRADPRWIARKLGITLRAARSALERLRKVGLLVEEGGRLRKSEKNYLFADVPSAAIRKHHQATLDLARVALREQPMGSREFFTVCFPMDPCEIDRAKARIRDFCASLMAELQETRPRSVYKLAVQFFRLDQEDVQ
jgi:uncharacterized protein (TIGR02147 family)